MWYGYITICLSILQLMDVWVSSLGLLWTFVCKPWCGHMFLFPFISPKIRIPVSYGRYIFNFVRKCQLFLSGLPSYIPTKSICEFQFLHGLVKTCCCQPFIFNFTYFYTILKITFHLQLL